MAEVRDYLISFAVFTFLIVGGVALLGGFREYDSSFANDAKFSEFNESFSKVSDFESQTDKFKGVFNSSDEDNKFGLFGVLDALIETAWYSLKSVFTSFSFIFDVFTSTTSIFGIPAWIPSLIISIIVIILTFAIFSAIFQRDV